MNNSLALSSIAFSNKHTVINHLVTLHDVASSEKNSIVDGPFGSSLKTSDYVADGIPVLQGKNITGNKFKFTDIRFISLQKSKELIRSKVVVGDILVIKIGSIGYAAEIDDLGGYPYAIIPANLAKISIDKNKIVKNYLLQWLKTDSVKKYFESVASKTAQPALSLGKIKDLPVPLPPLAEQQRIAALLDTADRILRLRESAIAKLDQLAQSVFVEMFGDVIKNNKGWTLKKLSEVTTKIGSGATPRGGDSEYKSDGISLIRSLNVHDGEFRTKNLAYIDDEQADKLSNVVVIENDVLLNITGASVARVCRVPNSVLPARVNQHVMIVRPNKSLNAVYLERLLLSAEMKNKLLSVGSSGATREAITKASAENLLIPVPPIKVQSEFCKKFELLENIKKNMLNCVDGNKQMSSSLQHQSFAVN